MRQPVNAVYCSFEKFKKNLSLLSLFMTLLVHTFFLIKHIFVAVEPVLQQKTHSRCILFQRHLIGCRRQTYQNRDRNLDPSRGT